MNYILVRCEDQDEIRLSPSLLGTQGSTTDTPAQGTVDVKMLEMCIGPELGYGYSRTARNNGAWTQYRTRL